MTRRFNLPALALVVAIPFLTCRQALAEADSAPEPGVDVQPRGPVHEAFAKPTAPNAEPGAVVPKKPPEPIPELPPDVRPKDEDAEWFSGYWAWDADKKDFVWVSGLWRVPPPLSLREKPLSTPKRLRTPAGEKKKATLSGA